MDGISLVVSPRDHLKIKTFSTAGLHVLEVVDSQEGEERATDMPFTDVQKILHNPQKSSESWSPAECVEFSHTQGIALSKRSPLPSLCLACCVIYYYGNGLGTDTFSEGAMF